MSNATQAYLHYGADQKFHLAPGRLCQIGRSLANEVVVQDAEVSRHHASVEARPTEFVLSDAGSRNGTYLNGARIAKPTPLRHGDVIQVGNTKITFHWPAAPGITPRISDDATMATVLPSASRYSLVLSMNGLQQVAQNADPIRLDSAISTAREQVEQIVQSNRLGDVRFAGDLVIFDSIGRLDPPGAKDLLERILNATGDIAIALEQIPAHAKVIGRIQISGGLWLVDDTRNGEELKEAIKLSAYAARAGSVIQLNSAAANQLRTRYPQAASLLTDAAASPFPGAANLQLFQLQQVIQG